MKKDVGTAADRVESFITYGSQHPNGEFISQESLDKASLQDAIDFYNNYSSPSNAYLVIIGDVNYDEIKSKVTNTASERLNRQIEELMSFENDMPIRNEPLFVNIMV